MLTPIFRCFQDEKFVIVTIFLSAVCKARESVFDICGNQFTFYCSPYYLRLRFKELLREGCGEKATFNVEKEELEVYLPKAVPGEEFTHLENPLFLAATEKQQRKMLHRIEVLNMDKKSREIKSVDNSAFSSDDSSEEVDFLQTAEDSRRLHIADENVYPTMKQRLNEDLAASKNSAGVYGFADAFSGLFERLDPDLVAEIVEIPFPHLSSRQDRRKARVEKENADFSVEELFNSTEEEEEAISLLLQYVPSHIQDFQKAISSEVGSSRSCAISSVVADENIHPVDPTVVAPEALEDEEGKEFSGERGGEIWCGNVLEFSQSVAGEQNSRSTTSSSVTLPAVPQTVLSSVEGSFSSSAPYQGEKEKRPFVLEVGSSPTDRSHSSPFFSSSQTLAIPMNKPTLKFTREEIESMMTAKLPPLVFPPSKLHVVCLTLDILLSEAYDDFFSEGNGCCESVWNLCKLSSSLSFLDVPETLYEACYFFARRLYTYPLYRDPRVLSRVFSMVGMRMMLGSSYVIRALLRVRKILSHSDHRHIFCTIFIDPLVAYWSVAKDANDTLLHAAKELHEHATRRKSIIVKNLPQPLSLSSLCDSDQSKFRSIVLELKPLILRNLDFPCVNEAKDEEESKS